MFRPFTSKPNNAAARHALRNAIEGLEARQLLANDPLTVGTFKSGKSVFLNVVGTANDDVIVVQRTANTTYRITNGTWAVNKTGTFAGVRVMAGAGADTVSTVGTLNFVFHVYGEAGADTINGGNSADYLNGGADNDSITGNGGNDSLIGDAGDDVLFGNTGNDLLNAGVGNDQATGGDGNDTLNGDAGDDVLTGNAGNDLLNAGAGNDQATGGDGNDTLNGDVGADTLSGDAGLDVLNGGADADSLTGGNDNDILNGDAGNDSLFGLAGNDTLNGGLGDDSVDGGENNDRVVGDLGNDVYIGGNGADTIDYTGRLVTLTLSLDGQANDGASGETDNIGSDFEYVNGGNVGDLITGNDSVNFLYGGAGNDTIDGAGGNDKLFGGAGLDSLSGGDGNDSLFGQADADKLFGDDGEDLLDGGAGNDQYDGGAGRDRLIALGGGTGDSLTGGDGLDSFWLDFDATEKLLDVDADETAARAVHRVKAFVNYGKTVISKEVSGQKFAEPALAPKTANKLANFSGYKLFADAGPSADDIEQGQVGDCWYLASLAAVADTNPEVIRQAITDLGDGTFAVRFFHATTGAEQYVRVDGDLFTYTWSTTTPLMASLGAENSTWVPLMEKALTWVRGSKLGQYATISGGWMNEAFSRLGMTNTVSWKGSINNASAMLDWLQTQLGAGKAVTTGFNAVSGANLVANHAYTVDRVNDNGDGTFSITLRNPWGTDGYSSNDGTNDGYVTLTSAQLFSNYTALMAAA